MNHEKYLSLVRGMASVISDEPPFLLSTVLRQNGRSKKKLDLKGANRFTAWKIFNNLVAASESPDEFIKLYKHYFGGDKLA